MGVRDTPIGVGEAANAGNQVFPEARPLEVIKSEVPDENEYEAVLAESKPDTGNEYEAFIQEDKINQASTLKQSMFVAAPVQPDQKAKSIQLSEKLQIPVPIVERNYEKFAKKAELESLDYDSLIRKSPSLSKWLENPDNATLSKDDIPNLQKVEDSVQDYSFLESSFRELNSGMASFISGAARIPALINQTGLLAINPFLDKEIKSPDWLLNNPLAKHYDEVAEAYRTPNMEASITDEISKGNYSKAGRVLFSQFVANAPQQAAIMAAYISGAGVPALVGAGAITGAQSLKDSDNSGASQSAQTINALTKGTIESAFESLGTFGVMRQWENVIAKNFGKQVSREVIKDFAKTMVYSVAGEGNEEFWTQLAQDLSDKVTGVNPDALKGTIGRALDAGLIGGFSGGAMVGPGAAIATQARINQSKSAALARDFYLAFGQSAEATKLRERLPQAQKDYIEQMTKGTGIENIYIPLEAMETYFQDDTTKFMQQIGALDAYNEAKETGSNIKIPLATWADKVVGTPEYAALADHIKFNPGEMSVDETKKAIEEEAKKAEETPAEKSASAVADQIKEQLIETGKYTPDEAAKQALIHEAAFTSLGERTGQDPAELFKQFNLKINQGGEGGQVLNQSDLENRYRKYLRTPGAEEAYASIPDTQGGKYINQDFARLLLPEYRASPSQNINSTQKPSSDFTQTLFDLALKKPVLGDASFIIGGPGAGKTTAGQSTLNSFSKVSDIVLDGVGANENQLFKNIDASLESGRVANVVFVFTPFERSIANIIDRYKKDNRPVPASVAARGHVKSLETYLKATEKYADDKRVHLYAVETNENFGYSPRTVEEIKNLSYIGPNETEAQSIERLQKLAEERLAGAFAGVESGSSGDAAGSVPPGKNGRTLFQNSRGAEAATSRPQVSSLNPDILGYYSKLQTEVSKMDFKSIPSKDLIGRINNLPGVKQEEIEWTGINDWLANVEGKVTKEQVDNYLKENGVKIEQTVLGSQGGADASSNLKWGEEKELSLAEIDPYGELQNEEANNYLQDDYWVNEEIKVIKERNPNISDKELEEALSDAASESATSYLQSGDHPWVLYRVKEEETDWTIEGSNDRSWVIEDANGRRVGDVEGDLEEAKIQAIRLMQEKGILDHEVKPTLETDIQWGRTHSMYEENTQAEKIWVKDNLKKFLDKKKKYYSTGYYKENPGSAPNKTEIRELAEKAASNEYRKKFDRQHIQSNEFKVDTENPFFRLSLDGSAKKGFDLTVIDDDSISTTIQAKNIEEAKSKAIEYMRSKKIVVDQLPGEKEKSINDPTGKSRYGQWTLDGGTNYREILLSLPSGVTESDFTQGHFKDNVVTHIRTKDRSSADGKRVLFIEEIQSDWHQKGRERGYQVSKEERTKLEAQKKELIEARDVFSEELEIKSSALKKLAIEKAATMEGPYKVKEGDEGFKGWVVYNENNSDNSINYGTKEQAEASVKSSNEYWRKQSGYRDASNSLDRNPTPEWTQIDSELEAIRTKSMAINKELQPIVDQLESGIPDAPFKNTEAWAMLAFKRILSMAAQDGYDVVSWAPGEVAADHYNMAEHVSDIRYKKDGESYMLNVSAKGGSEIDLPQPSYKEKDLVELLGKETAMKIIAGDGETDSHGRKILFAKDLKLGGEGHKYFYNKILPKTLQKYLSKLDPSIKIENSELFGSPLTTDSNEFDKFWSVEISDDLKSKIAEGQTLFQEGKRGQIRIGNQSINIDLLAGADLSTFLHESAHFYLEVIKDIAGSDKATPQLKEDFKTIQNWLGIKEGEPISREQHEQFASGFEAYLMTGKAPSSKLRKAFAAFRVWLTEIYKHIKNIKNYVELTPEVTEVFDRLLATDAEIEAAQLKQNRQPIFPNPIAAGMSPEVASQYSDQVKKAINEFEDDLRGKLLNDIEKKKEKEYQANRKKVEDEVAQQVSESNVYKGIETLQSNEIVLGLNEPLKLSREGIDKELIKKLPRGIFAKEGGLDQNIVAEMLHFESADSMLTQMANAPKKKEAIATLTDQRMKELYPDLMNSEALANEAMKSIHSDERAKLLRMQLEHLASNNLPALKDVIRKTVRRVPTEKAVRDQAAKIIASKNIQEIKPYLFERAEAKAAKEAGQLLAKGDIDGAFEAKRRELLNHELYRAAVKANETIDKAIKKWKRIAKADEDLSKSRDIDLVNAARALLAQHGLGKSNGTAEDYLAAMKKYDEEAYETIKALLDRDATPFQDMKFNDFVTLKDTVDAIWSLSKSQKEIEIDGVKMSRDLAIEQLSGSLPPDGNLPGYKKAATGWDQVKMGLLGMRSALRKVESWVDAMDLGNIQGAFRKYLHTPVADSINKYRDAKKEKIKEYLKIVKAVEKSLIHKEIRADELGYVFSGKSELLGALLHTGNRSNKSKLVRGRGWGLEEDFTRWDAFVKRMEKTGVITKADWDFVQGVWDLLESMKADAQKAHKAMYGFYFNEITSDPVQTSFGEYRGGYVPAVADPFVATDANIRNEKEMLEKFNNSFMFPTAGKGFTKSRVQQYAAPLTMDLRFIPSHIDKVLRFTYIEPSVKQTARIVMNRAFRAKLDAFDPTIGGDMLVPWLQRSAQQKVATPSQGRSGQFFDQFWREIRNRTGLQIMVLNVVNTLQQFTGFSIAAVKVRPKYLRNALWDYMKGPGKLSEEISEKSSFMRNRTSTQAFEIQSDIDDLLLNPSKYDKARDFAKRHGYFMQQGTQNIVDLITWNGAYNQAVEEGLSENEAVRSADSAVRLTQGSFNPEDISKFETGSPFVRLFTQFYSYFNMQANLLGSEFSIFAKQLGLKKGAGRAFYIYTMGFMIPAFLSELLVRSMSGHFDDDDDDSVLDDIMDAFFRGQFNAGTAMFPIVGPAIRAGINAANDKWYDDRISTSPVVSSLESAVHAPVSVYNSIAENGSKKKAIRDTLTLLGLLTGVPVAPLSRPLGYLSDVSEGEAVPTGPIDYARGLLTGKSGQ